MRRWLRRKKVDISHLYQPGKVLVVDTESPNASDDNPGSIEKPFKTINAAAQKAQPGMTVIVREGLYRERVIPQSGGTKNSPIVYMGVDKEKVIVRGSDALEGEWTKSSIGPEAFELAYAPEIFAGNPNPFLLSISVGPKDSNETARPSTEEVMPFSLGQIFVNGKPLTQVQKLNDVSATQGSWIVSADGKTLYVNFPKDFRNPHDCQIELSVRNRILFRMPDSN